MKKKSVTIYPCNSASMPLVRFFSQISGSKYELKFCCTQAGSGVVGMDIAKLDGRPPMGIIAVDDIETAAKNSDVVFITPGDISDKNHIGCLTLIEKCLCSGKEVFCFASLPQSEKQLLTESYPHSFFCADNLNLFSNSYSDDLLYTDHDTPVVFVGGLSPETNVTEVLLGISLSCRKAGLRVSGIGSEVFLRLFDLHTYEDILKAFGISNDKRVFYLKRRLKRIEHEEHPDILVVELPGALVKHNNAIKTGFGIDAQIVSQAIDGDYGIVCINGDCVDTGFIDAASKYIENRYHFPVDGIHVSNAAIDGMLSMSRKTHQIFHLPEDFINARLKSYQGRCIAYNLLNDTDCDKLVQDIISNLSE